MECPVCKTIASKTDENKCAVCATDLEIFSLLEAIEQKSARRKRSAITLFILLILFAGAAAAYYFYFFELDQNKQQDAAETIRQQQIEIQDLTGEKQALMLSVIELRKEVRTLTDRLDEINTKETLTGKPATPAFREIIHVVKRGESLKRIAKKYYGSSAEYVRIMRENNIRNANHIMINQRLKIIVPVTD